MHYFVALLHFKKGFISRKGRIPASTVQSPRPQALRPEHATTIPWPGCNGSGRRIHNRAGHFRQRPPDSCGDDVVLTQVSCAGADLGDAEKEWSSVPLESANVWLRTQVTTGANVRFSYSVDGASFIDVGAPFVAKPKRWIGAKVGLFALPTSPGGEFGYADFDAFKVE